MNRREPPPGDDRRRAPDGRLYVPSAVRWAKTAKLHRPYPVEDLAPVLGIAATDEKLTSKIALALGLNRTSVRRYRRLGLTRDQAEAWAERAGVRPETVWGAWGADETAPQEVPAPAWLRAS